MPKLQPSMEHFNHQTLTAIRDIEEGRNLKGPFDDVDGLLNSLNAED